jgi:hypothetical protein
VGPVDIEVLSSQQRWLPASFTSFVYQLRLPASAATTTTATTTGTARESGTAAGVCGGWGAGEVGGCFAIEVVDAAAEDHWAHRALAPVPAGFGQGGEVFESLRPLFGDAKANGVGQKVDEQFGSFGMFEAGFSGQQEPAKTLGAGQHGRSGA